MITLFKKLKSLLKEKEKPNDLNFEYENKLNLIDKIDNVLFDRFNNKNNSAIVIRALYSRITTYNHKLKEVNNFLSKDKVVYNAWCLETEKTIPVCEFFLDDKNQYIDEAQEVNEFKVLSIVFLSFYYERSALVEVGEHNTRVLSHFKDSLLNTIEDLTLIAN